jgi:hypothetical protein
MNRLQFNKQTQYRGNYPAVLTTDGISYEIEYRANHDGWKANDTIIAHLSCSDSIPSFSECERRRKAVKNTTKHDLIHQ